QALGVPLEMVVWLGHHLPSNITCGNWLVLPLNENGPCCRHGGAATAFADSGELTILNASSCSIVAFDTVSLSELGFADGAELAHVLALNTGSPPLPIWCSAPASWYGLPRLVPTLLGYSARLSGPSTDNVVSRCSLGPSRADRLP